MTDDLELETRLRAHYRHLEPGPTPGAWTSQVERALDRRARPATAPRRWFGLAAAVLVAVGVVGGFRLLDMLQLSAAPSPSGPAVPVTASPAPASPDASAAAQADATADLVGRFGADGIWAIRADQLLVSSDMGATWRPGSAPTPASTDGRGVRAATMFDADLGWVVTSGPGTTGFSGAQTDVQTLVVHRTVDGGKTWRSTALGGNFPGVSVSIAFADNLRGYILITPWRISLTRATVFATEDGGASWHISGTNDTWALDPLGSEFTVSSTSTLIAAANQEAGPNLHPLAAFSLDGGATWQVAKVPGLEGRAGGGDVYFAAPPTLDGVVGAAVVDVLPAGPTTHLYSTDGQDWAEVGSVPGAATTGVMDLGDGHWLIAAENPSSLLVTMDAGQTWQPVKTTGLPSDWQAIDGGAFDRLHAWMRIDTNTAANGSGQLFLTAKGGRTWAPASFGIAAPSPTPVPASPSLEATPSPVEASPAPTAAATTPTPAPSSTPVSPAQWGPLSIARLSPGPSGTTQVVRWAGGWLALGNGTDADGWLSRDGRVWSAIPAGTFGQTPTLGGAPLGTGLLVFAESGGVDTVWRSDDGVAWTSMPMERVAFGDGAVASDGAIVVAVRSDGQPGVLVSSDGRSWGVGVTADGTSLNPTSVVYRADVGFVAVGSTGGGLAAAWISEDGLRWTPATVDGGGKVAGVALMSLVSAGDGLVAVGHTGGTPGAVSYWVGTVAGRHVVFAPSSANPLGEITAGEGSGSNTGNISGDGSWMLEWGARSGSTKSELWASRDGTHWTRVTAAAGFPSTRVWGVFPVGDAILFGSGESGTPDWLGTMAGG